MQNVLTFPNTLENKKRKKSFVERIRVFLTNHKIQKEIDYKRKIDFLKKECYKHYLKRILNEREKEKTLDIPRFMYERGFVICWEAVELAKQAVEITEKRHGKKFIEHCYKSKLKENNK